LTGLALSGDLFNLYVFCELAAVASYGLAATTDPGPIEYLFAFLADEETQRKAELEKVYHEIVDSGGV